MSKEMIIMDKTVYHGILKTVKTMGKNHDAEDLFELGDRIYELNELLEKVDDLDDKILDIFEEAVHNERITMSMKIKKGDE